jgi:aspartate racemase
VDLMTTTLPASIGIVGGVGPWVDVVLLRKLLAEQAARGAVRDQDGVPTLLAQCPALIADRTAYLVRRGRPDAPGNPGVGAARVARALIDDGAVVIGIPCNTFHSPEIFDAFREALRGAPVRIVHMVEEALSGIRRDFPAVRKVGVLSTNGTYRFRIYADALEASGAEALTLAYRAAEPPEAEQTRRKDAILAGDAAVTQNDVHHAIYHGAWGIKSGREASAGYPTARAVLEAALRELAGRGAEAVILGCTELALVLSDTGDGGPALVDPLDALARGLLDAYREATRT